MPLNDRQLRTANALTLQWHSGAAAVSFDAFRPWALAGLKTELPFDGAMWGMLSPGEAAAPRLIGAYFHGIDEGALPVLAALQASEAVDGVSADKVLNICIADSRWQSAAHEALRLQAVRHNMMNWLSAHFVDIHAPGRQMVLVSRKAASHRFGKDEATQFEWLAPHMMQAFATRRRVYLDKAATAGQTLSAVAVAMVDRDGFVHDLHARFAALLRREWNDWPGKRLPAPLLDLVSRQASNASRRFIGSQMSFECVPADDFCVVTVRPRQRTDGLTEREGDVARRYADGDSFREVAESLQVSPATVRSHLRNVFGKLQVRNKAQLAAVLRQGA